MKLSALILLVSAQAAFALDGIPSPDRIQPRPIIHRSCVGYIYDYPPDVCDRRKPNRFRPSSR